MSSARFLRAARAIAAVGVLTLTAANADDRASCVSDPARGVSKQEAAPVSRRTRRTTPKQLLFSGRVVLVQDALKRRGIEAGEQMKNQVALETADGALIPIVADWRGRAFFQDARLRDRKVELTGFRRSGIPYLQVLNVYTFDEQGVRMEVDYWCDTCAIPMYELKECDCCQGPIRLRFRPAELPGDLQLGSHPDTPRRSETVSPPPARQSSGGQDD